MFILGLTGSVGMGKSTTAKFFAEEGVPVHDAVAAVHRLYEGEAVAPIEAAFPGTTANGKVDRDKLAASVVGNVESLKRLEAIVHPLVRAAEQKFLANADRGLDGSTLSRDIVDLAFMIEGWSTDDAVAGLDLARTAYGESVTRGLTAVTDKVRKDRAYRNRCIEGLGIEDTKAMAAGLGALARF